MKINKVNEEFVKIYFKTKKVFYQKVNKYVYLSDSYRIYRLNEENCLLDTSKFIETKLENFMNCIDYNEGIITNELVVDKYKLRVIKTFDENEIIYVNDNFLKLFDNPRVMVKDKISPIYVYEKDELVGMLLPCKVI